MPGRRGASDYGLKLDELLEHLTVLSAATDLPVNADFESGFADDPAGVAENVRKAAATGVAGLSVENRTQRSEKSALRLPLSVERIRAARAALDDDESGVFLVARCEGFLTGEANLDMTIKRLVAFAEAGADCLYAPGIRTPEQISAVVKAVAPKPVNVLVMSPDFKVAELAELGVRRVSLGGQLAAAAWGGFMRAAKEIAEQGHVQRAEEQLFGAGHGQGVCAVRSQVYGSAARGEDRHRVGAADRLIDRQAPSKSPSCSRARSSWLR